MFKTFIAMAAALASTTAMPAYASTFSPAPGTVSGTGTGFVNGTACTPAAVTGAVDSSGNYADVTFDNSATACAAYGVTARVWANGDLSNVVVTYLPTNTVICSSGSTTLTGAVTLTNVSPNVNAYIDDTAPVQVGACALAVDITVGPAQII